MAKKIAFIAFIMVLAATPVCAQSKAGTTIGDFLLIEPSARIAGMGNAGATMYSEIQAVYYNPAAIGLLSNTGVQFSHIPWLAGISYNFAAAALPLGSFGNVYAGVTALNSGEIDVRTVEQEQGTGERYTVSDIAIGIGYGRQVSDRFSVGVQAFYLQETIWHSSLNAFALSVGTLYRISADGLHIGASISNFGTRGRYDGRDLRIKYDQNPEVYGDNGVLPGELVTGDFPLPVLFRVGVGLPVRIGEQNRLSFAVDALHRSDNTESMNFGVEWEFLQTLMLRGGYQDLFQQDAETGLTLGVGVRYAMDAVQLSFDYGWVDHGRLEKVNMLTLGVSF
jgi:hypothetical protein